jgi:hypothetical protein
MQKDMLSRMRLYRRLSNHDCMNQLDIGAPTKLNHEQSPSHDAASVKDQVSISLCSHKTTSDVISITSAPCLDEP